MGNGPLRPKSSVTRARFETVDVQLGAAFEKSTTAMCVLGLDGSVLGANDSMCRLLDRPRIEVIGCGWTKLTNASAVAAGSPLVTMIRSDPADRFEVEEHVDGGDGVDARWRSTASLLRVEGGAPLFLVETVDVTENYALVQRTKRAEERIQLATAASQDAFIAMDATGAITAWNDAAEGIFGWRADEVVGRSLAATLVPEDRRAAHVQGLARYLRTGEERVLNKKVEVKALRRDGTELLVELTIWPVATAAGVEFNAFLRDVSERLRFQEELRALAVAATTDQGTGLKNRRGFFALAQHELNVAHRLGHSLTLIFFDLDRLKHINDTLGHLEGDRAIADTAHLLSHAFRESDLVARIGGDEFCVLAIGPPDAFAHTMRRFEQALEDHNRTAARRFELSLSYGVAFFEPTPEKMPSLDDLLSQADASMYESKMKRRSA